MKRKRQSPLEIDSLQKWSSLQRIMAASLFRPLMARPAVAVEFIKPNAELGALDRFDIYHRQYWFRVLECLYEDYPGLRAVLGDRAFAKLAEAYLTKYPSTSYTLRNLGSKLEKFLREEPKWAGKKQPLALDIAKFEWAQVVAFDSEAQPPISVAQLQEANPAQLKLRLQPHITLLALDYAVDEFLLQSKKREAHRTEASHALDSAPEISKSKRIQPPKAELVFLAVHRHDFSLYYKRMAPEAFLLLQALQKGRTLEQACARAVRQGLEDWENKIREWFKNWSSLGWFW